MTVGMPWAVATVAPRFGYIKERQWHHGRGYEDHPDSSLIVKFHLSDLRDMKRKSLAAQIPTQTRQTCDL